MALANSKYKHLINNGILSRKKITSMLPALIFSSFSTMIISSCDGLIGGNFVGSDALASISYLNPLITFISIFTLLICGGLGTYFAQVQGKNDKKERDTCLSTGYFLTILLSIFVLIVQYPVARITIISHNLSPVLESQVMKYAYGLFISNFFSAFSVTCAYLLISYGGAKLLASLSIAEGLINLLLDFIFTGLLDMGILGLSFSNAISGFLRATASIYFLAKKTALFSININISFESIKKIVKTGAPLALDYILLAIQAYYITIAISKVFGSDGIASRTVAIFLVNLANIIVFANSNALTPLLGIYTSMKNFSGCRKLMRISLVFVAIPVALLGIVFFIYPQVAFSLHGIKSALDFQYDIVKIYAMFLLPNAINFILRKWFIFNDKKYLYSLFSTLENVILPIVFVYIFTCMNINIFFAFPISSFIVMIVTIIAYKACTLKCDEIQYLSYFCELSAENSDETVKNLHSILDNCFCPEKLHNRARLVSEELINAVISKDTSPNIVFGIKANNKEVLVLMLDNSGRKDLKKSTAVDLTVDSYEIVSRAANEIEYEYILDMNYVIVKLLK